MQQIRLFLLISLGFVLFSSEMQAQKTQLMVRALAGDAKFIGPYMGGAKIVVRDAETREILDSGRTKGSTGNTQTIVLNPKERYERISDENTAGFTAQLDIEEPTFVTVEVLAPASAKQSRLVSATQLWMIPGKDILDEGLIIDVPGFVVSVTAPKTLQTFKNTETISVEATVVMMCGCPVNSEGTWDANRYEVKGILKNQDGNSKEITLKPSEESSTFSALTKLQKGTYELQVYAFHEETANTGLDKVTFTVN